MHMVTSGFDKGGNEQYSLLVSLRELTALRRRVAWRALSHEGGRNPYPTWALNSVFALHMHVKRVKKPGWKQRQKKGRSPRSERSCCTASGQTREGLAACRGNKAKLHSLLPAADTMETADLWLNTTTLTTCGYFRYYQEKLFFFFSRGSPSGSCSGVCGWRCASALLLRNPDSPRNLHCKISGHKNLAIFSA